jgi:hypothetical protein
MTSAYPDEIYDRHGVPRIPAATPAVPYTRDSPSRLHKGLALSLMCYVNEDDAVLDRRAFLSMVCGRIEADLETGDY